ncbi:helix-turn-helix domain-containing protein [Patescibacteria group bacterium]|nr:MAG: helix-turn-helix domain-containing protein [Patescibacteria group bacterium]
MSFVIRKLNENGTVGATLHAMRKAVGWTLSELAAKTKIPKTVLDAIEKDAHDKLPAPLYARQYLKVYAKALGGDPEYFLHRFDAERGTCDFLGATRLPIGRTSARQLFVGSRLLKAAGFAAVALALCGYLGLEVRRIVSAPDIALSSPSDGFTTDEASVRVSGEADPDAKVLVNGVHMLLQDDGTFATDVMLERGLNVITVEGAKRYSKTASLYRRVILDQEGEKTADAVREEPRI